MRSRVNAQKWCRADCAPHFLRNVKNAHDRPLMTAQLVFSARCLENIRAISRRLRSLLPSKCKKVHANRLQRSNWRFLCAARETLGWCRVDCAPYFLRNVKNARMADRLQKRALQVSGERKNPRKRLCNALKDRACAKV